MILYATIENGELSREAKKGSDEFLEIYLTAFNKKIGAIILTVERDAEGQKKQYLLTFKDSEKIDDPVILKEYHKKEGTIQTIAKKSPHVHDWDKFGKCCDCGKWDKKGERLA